MCRRLLGSFSITFLLTATALLGAAGAASAATVVNGGFETGSLQGWTVAHTARAGGHWSVYDAETAPLYSVPAPPDGLYAAVSHEEPIPDTMLLYQEVALEPLMSHILSLTLYYHSAAPISVPEPDTLGTGEAVLGDQQLRVDVVKPSAENRALAPEDILATAFASHDGDPSELAPTQFSVDLSPFAGQTVRIRIAAVADEGQLNVGVDDVAVTSTPLPVTLPAPVAGGVTTEAASPPPPSNVFMEGKLALDRRTGSGRLSVTLPDAGALTVYDARRQVAIASHRGDTGRRPIIIRTATIEVPGPQTVRVPIRPTAAAKKVLARTGKLPFHLQLAFTPTGGAVGTGTYKGTLVKRVRRVPR